MLRAAKVVLSLGREPVVVEFPSDPARPFADLQERLVEGKPQDCYIIGHEYHDSIGKGQVIRVIAKGRLIDGRLEQKAEVTVSKGPAPEINYPSACGITLEQAKAEISGRLSSSYMLEYAFQAGQECYSDSYPARTICKIREPGAIKNGAVQRPAVVILSKGAKPVGRYRVSESGVIRDTKTGLEWLVGPDKDTTWYEAEKWVKRLNGGGLFHKKIAGGGWRLPTKEELRGIYEKDKGSRNMDPVFKATGWFVWSSETPDSSSAWGFYFYYGHEHWLLRDYSYHTRGFAVRSGGR